MKETWSKIKAHLQRYWGIYAGYALNVMSGVFYAIHDKWELVLTSVGYLLFVSIIHLMMMFYNEKDELIDGLFQTLDKNNEDFNKLVKDSIEMVKEHKQTAIELAISLREIEELKVLNHNLAKANAELKLKLNTARNNGKKKTN